MNYIETYLIGSLIWAGFVYTGTNKTENQLNLKESCVAGLLWPVLLLFYIGCLIANLIVDDES